MAAVVKGNTELQDDARTNADVASITPEVQAKQNKAAKRDADKQANRLKKSSKRGFSRFIPLIIILFVIGVLVAVVGFDVLGLRTKYLNGLLRNIPIVKDLVPEDNNNQQNNVSNEELLAQIDMLNKTIEDNKTEIESLNKKNDAYVQQIAKLQEFEKKQEDFKAQKAEFDNMIALNDPNAYAKFYEAIDPQNAEALYKEVVGTNQNTKELNNYVATFSDMDEARAAGIFEQMIATDMDLVVLILKNITPETRGAIIGRMAPENGASVAKMMAPATTGP